MLILNSTDIIRLITSSIANLSVHTSFIDNNAGAITPNRQNTLISSATTTTVVTSPGTGIQRNIKLLTIHNSHASLSNDISVVLYDSVIAPVLFKATIAPGEVLQYADDIGFSVFANSGAVKTSLNQGTNTTTSNMSSVVLTGDIINNNATLNSIADVTGLSFPVTAGKKYWFKFIVPYTSAITTTGSRWSIRGPSTTLLSYQSRYSLTATTETINQGLSAYDLPAASNASSLAVGNTAIVEGLIQPSANGDVILRFASEIASSAITAKAGAVCYYQEVA